MPFAVADQFEYSTHLIPDGRLYQLMGGKREEDDQVRDNYVRTTYDLRELYIEEL